jgi:hypothetical protein
MPSSARTTSTLGWVCAVIVVVVIAMSIGLGVVLHKDSGLAVDAGGSTTTPVQMAQHPLAVEFKMRRHALPIAKVHVNGDGPLRCVLDTASTKLNVASRECRQCDARMGVIDMDGDEEAPAGYSPQSVRHIRYGSQHDKVEQIVGSVRIGDTTVPNMQVFVTTERKNVDRAASFNFNVMGLMGADRGGTVHHHLVPRGEALVMKYWHQKGMMMSLPEAEIEKFPIRVQWLRPPTVPFRYYTVPISHVAVPGTSRRPRTLVSAPSLRYAVVDTGSNMTSVPRHVFRRLLPHLKQNQPVAIYFAGNSVPLTIPYQSYRWNGDPKGDLMINDDVSMVNAVAGTMILGSFAMQFHTLAFGRDHLCIQSSHDT